MFILFIVLVIMAFVPFVTFYVLRLLKDKTNGDTRTKTAKALATAALSLEIFKFFLCASLFESGKIPSHLLPFNILTLLSVAAMFAAFSDGKLGKCFGNLVFFMSAAAVACTVCTEKTFFMFGYSQSLILDPHYLFVAVYAVQAGLLLTVGIFSVKKQDGIRLSDMLKAQLVNAAVFGLTAITNAYFSSSYLLEYSGSADAKSQLLLCSLISDPIAANAVLIGATVLFIAVGYFVCKLLKKSTQGGQDVLH